MIHKLLALLFSVLLLSSSAAFAATTNFQYDTNGNLLATGEQKYEYNGFNQLVKVFDTKGKLVEEYSYDESGNRIRKIEYVADGKTQKTYYVGKGLVRVVNEKGTFDTRYMYDNNGVLVARKDPNGKIFYYQADHLGSTSLMTDEKGSVVEETTYLPFGEVLDGGVKEKFLYTGKEKDVSGLYYYGARYYDPQLKKFTQADTVIPDMYDPQSLNRYSYVKNNPYTYVDRDGHVWDTFLDLGFIGYDLYNIFDDPTDVSNWAALGADVAFAFVPVLTGGGLLVKSVSKAGKSVSVAEKGVSMGGKAGKGIEKGVTKEFSKTIDIKEKYNLFTSNKQKFYLNDILASHKLTDKAAVLSPEKLSKMSYNHPAELWQINGKIVMNDGMGRSAREKIIFGNDYVFGKILNPTPGDIDGAKVALDFHNRHAKGKTVAEVVNGLEKME